MPLPPIASTILDVIGNTPMVRINRITRGVIDATLYLLLFFPGIALFFWMGLQEALHAWDIREVSDASPWRPILYPFKAVIPLSLLLLMIQGVSEFLKSAYAARTGRPL